MVFYNISGNDDFMFRENDKIIIHCQPISRAYKLDWELCHNLLNEPFASGSEKINPDHSFSIDLSDLPPSPGFYDLNVTVHHSIEQRTEGTTTFGWDVEKFKSFPITPADFKEFWEEEKAQLDCIDLNLICSKVKDMSLREIDEYNVNQAAIPECFDPEGVKYDNIEVYKVSFQGIKSFNGNSTVHAWFAKPAGDGVFPSLLVLPGAGNAPRPIPAEHARHGFATLDIQVHCEPVDKKDDEYSALPENKFDDNEFELENMSHYYVYLNALQAVNALSKLPGVDPDRMAVIGGSQGGRLSTIVAAMDKRIKAAVPAIAHYSYISWLHWTQRMQDEKNSGGNGFSTDNIVLNRRLEMESYYDISNFAPLIECPVLMNAGLIDKVSSPTGIYAAFNRLNCPKQIFPLPNQAHDWSPAFDAYAWQWLTETLH
jgi:cephalosporin-C deacetylase-like acetyl esterase